MEREELICYIGIISSQWATIEDRIMHIFSLAMQTNESLSSVILDQVHNQTTRLDMICLAIARTASQELADKFKALHKQIRKRAGERVKVIHCSWSVHDAFPDEIIRWKGMGDPELNFEAYSKKDFLEIIMRLLDLEIVLKRYWDELADFVSKQHGHHEQQSQSQNAKEEECSHPQTSLQEPDK